MSDKPGYHFTIDLPVRTEWESVDLLRASIQTCFTAVFKDVDGCERLAMVTGELLENAVKYGAWHESGAPRSFRLHVSGIGGNAKIRVDNPAEPGDPGVERLFKTIEWMSNYTNVGEMYRDRLLEYANGAPGTESRLGLIRVAYEGGCKLTANLEGETLSVVAHFDLAA